MEGQNVNAGNSEAERFLKTLKSLLKIISDIITDLHESQLTHLTSTSIDFIITFIDRYSVDSLISCIASMHSEWEKVSRRDESFILTVFPEALKSNKIPIDCTVFTIPFTVYHSLQTDKRWRDVPKDDRPLNQDDLDTIWEHIETLIAITCKYIYRMRREKMNNADDPDSILDHIDLTKYSKMFSFTLPK